MYGKDWQKGPAHLMLPQSDWPHNRYFATTRKNEVYISKKEVNKKYRDLVNIPEKSVRLVDLVEFVDNLPAEISINKVKTIPAECQGPEHPDNEIVKKFQGGHVTNEWEVLLKRTSVYFYWSSKMTKNESGEKQLTAFDMAKYFWIRVAMSDTRKAHAEGKLRKLTLWEKDGMLVVSGRAEEGLKLYFGEGHLPVLMSGARVSNLIMLWAHTRDHAGRDTTLNTATQVAWIVGGRKLAGKITEMCIRCRFLRKQLENQKMAVLPARLTVPAAPFQHIGLDLIGPFLVKRMGGAKATRGGPTTYKAWAILILCLTVKALRLYLTAGYSTKDFLLCMDEHEADHGEASTIHSDRGSQLLSAAKEVDVPEYDWDAIEKSSGANTQWFFCPSGAQYRNGSSEAFVKKVKRSIEINYKDKLLTYQELNTALKRVASVLNSRPISATASNKGSLDPDFITALTPNMMLLGRANPKACTRTYEDTGTALDRLAYVAELEALWWNQHKVQDFMALVPTNKWCEEKRNQKEGDIILIKYTSQEQVRRVPPRQGDRGRGGQ